MKNNELFEIKLLIFKMNDASIITPEMYVLLLREHGQLKVKIAEMELAIAELHADMENIKNKQKSSGLRFGGTMPQISMNNFPMQRVFASVTGQMHGLGDHDMNFGSPKVVDINSDIP